MAYSNYDVAHNFAHQTGKKMHSTNMFYKIDGNISTIYSYGWHFGIATLFKDKKTVFFTDDRYSISTSKHVNYVDGALGDLYTRIHVPIETSFLRNGTPTKHRLKQVLNVYNERIESLVLAQVRARKRNYMTDIRIMFNNAKKFCTFFKCKNLVTGNLRKAIYSDDLESIYFSDEQLARYKNREKFQRERDKKRLQESIKAFHNFDTRNINSTYTYLRYNKERNVVETSKGMSLGELELLKKLWRFMKQGKEVQNPFSIQGYNVDAVTKDYVKAGCHVIKRNEAERLAKQLNF